MAKFQVGTGIDQYVDQLKNLEFHSEEMMGKAIYKGAGIVADAVKNNIRSLPSAACSKLEKSALIDGMGIAPMRNEGGYYNVKIGFDGYDSVKTKTFPNGRPISMIARSIEKGTTWRNKSPFVAPAVRTTKDKAEQAMAEEINKEIKNVTG